MSSGTRKGVVEKKASSAARSPAQSITAGRSPRDQHEVLQHRHVRHQGEVLVDHAEPELVRLARMGDRDLAAVEQDLALVGGVVAHGAFDQRALAGAVLAQQRMEGAGLAP